MHIMHVRHGEGERGDTAESRKTRESQAREIGKMGHAVLLMETSEWEQGSYNDEGELLAAALQSKSRLQREDVPRQGLFPAAHKLFGIHERAVE